MKRYRHVVPMFILGVFLFIENGYAYDGSIIPIRNCTELQSIENDLGAKYELINDIDCQGEYISSIGNTGAPFNGQFNGNNHTISNFFISESGELTGLFGATYHHAVIENLILENITIDASHHGNVSALVGIANGGTTISNVKLVNSKIQGGGIIGGLVGFLENGEIINSSVENTTIKINGSAYAFVGGLVGNNYGNIEDSSTKIIIECATADGCRTISYVGGLVGHNTGNISYSHARGSITAEGTIGGLVGGAVGNIYSSHANMTIVGLTRSKSEYLGGLVGYSDGNITGSYANGELSGQNHLIGGLVGMSNKFTTILNSYSSANIIVSNSKLPAGLINYCKESQVINTYAAGNITGTVYRDGGLIVDAYFHTVTGSYWDIQTTGQLGSLGGKGKASEDMLRESTYQGWDFLNVWEIREGKGYPTLRQNPEILGR